ncbi:MAG: flagellin [Rhizobiaceae bacterium]|nr:flagellin [Rhizobiaceae bacterium]MCZ8351758.1 flagellin [Rhizobium sp.]
MSSILTNSAAISALQTLRSISNSIAVSQQQASSGLRVGNASDDVAYWSVATSMRSDNLALSSAQDAIGLGAAKVDVAYGGVSAVVDLMKDFKARLVTASEDGVDRSKVNIELSQLRDQMRSIVENSSFSGENWLHLNDQNSQGWNTPKNVVSGILRNAQGQVSVTTLEFGKGLAELDGLDDLSLLIDDVAGTGRSGLLTSNAFAAELGVPQAYVIMHTKGAAHNTEGIEIELTSATTADQVADMIDVVEAVLAQTVRLSAQLGSLSARIDLQEEFSRRLGDSIDQGIGRLVDAEMSATSTRLKALQTQQQLATQALSIANGSTSNLLQLFR